MPRKIVIWGCGGHGREINYLCEFMGIEVVGYLDERPEFKNRIIDDRPVLGDIRDIDHLVGQVEILCTGVGSPTLKRHFCNKTLASGHCIADAVIHPDVNISNRNSIGKGSVICAGVTMTVNIHIGEHVIVNRNATLGHDVQIGDYATVSPGVNISGNVSIGVGSFIGTGASIQEKIRVGDDSVVGGGAYLRTHVDDNSLFVGVPATFLRKVIP
ncbi:MAG: acetyltransferase [Gammaproteobacteria bacterium]|nr:acetyltransferase [Gammaproteobacteria bacterium]